MALKARTEATRGRKKSGDAGYSKKSSKFQVQTQGSEQLLKGKKQRQQDTF